MACPSPSRLPAALPEPGPWARCSMLSDAPVSAPASNSLGLSFTALPLPAEPASPPRPSVSASSSAAPGTAPASPSSPFAQSGLAAGQWAGRARKQPPAPLALRFPTSRQSSPTSLLPSAEYDDWEPLPITPLSATRRGRESFALSGLASGLPGAVSSERNPAAPDPSGTPHIASSCSDETASVHSRATSFSVPLSAVSFSTAGTSPPPSSQSLCFSMLPDPYAGSACPSPRLPGVAGFAPARGSKASSSSSSGSISMHKARSITHHATHPALNTKFLSADADLPLRNRLASDSACDRTHK